MPESTSKRGFLFPPAMVHGHLAYLIVLLGVMSGAASFLLLLELVEEIWFESEIGAFDLRFFQWMQGLSSASLDGLFLTVTRLGNAPALMAVAATMGVLLLLARRVFVTIAMAGCFAGTAATVMAMKWLLQRDRPVPPLPLILTDNPAFPSAHATLSLVVYVFCAYLVAQHLGTISKRVSILGIGFSLAFLIGLSRLYLGVHWLSDVLGGYALGGVWLALLVTITEVHRIKHPRPRLDHVRLRWMTWGVCLLIPALILYLLLYCMGWQAG